MIYNFTPSPLRGFHFDNYDLKTDRKINCLKYSCLANLLRVGHVYNLHCHPFSDYGVIIFECKLLPARNPEHFIPP